MAQPIMHHLRSPQKAVLISGRRTDSGEVVERYVRLVLSLIIDRLTHSQTRYLMSEFARQAHPDVAQRERLSREIPGLSSRQVQVWFQNR